MRILYVTFDNPAVETILGGMNDDKLWGLPALYYPFKKLLEEGNTVDLMLVSPQEEKTLVESEHFKEENFIHVVPPKGPLASIRFPAFLARETRKILKRRKYDFVYGLAEGAVIAVRQARKMGIPCGYRQFGIYNDLEKHVRKHKTALARRIAAFIRHTYVYIAMRTKMDFILTTNDGSHQDKLFELMKIKKKFKYFFWRSGIKIPAERPMPDTSSGKCYPEAFDRTALVNIGRFSPEKRQYRSATVLGLMHKRGKKMHLYYVADATVKPVMAAIMEEAEKWGVGDYVHFVGKQPQEVCWQYARNSFVSLLPNESGLVNVFYENLAQGAAIVAAKTSTLDEYIVNGENGFQFETEEEAADYIEKLLEDDTLYQRVRSSAYTTATEKVISIDKRFGMEVELIKDTAMRRPMDKYPERL